MLRAAKNVEPGCKVKKVLCGCREARALVSAWQSHADPAGSNRERGSSQSSAEGLRCDSLVTIIWTQFSRVHISKPIHRKRCKTLWTAPTGACWGCSCTAVNYFCFMHQAGLHQSRACHAGAFQDRVKTICSLETGSPPGGC